VVGVPLICPVALLSDRPGGKLMAVKEVAPEEVRVALYAVPTVPLGMETQGCAGTEPLTD
jgi:hypothetical protein